MNYDLMSWLLFFFTYCVIGWIWETLYVSLRKRELVNRGFLYGPWIPIYGFGAIIILWLTLPVRSYIPLIFLLGMSGATLLEYVTGATMERIFHMRYWDYSNRPLNLNGHICLPVSLAWGVASVLLVEYVHAPIERIMLLIPKSLSEATVLIMVALFAADVMKSVQDALNLKELLSAISENNQTLSSIETRVTQITAQMADNAESFRQRMQEIEDTLTHKLELRRQGKQVRAQTRKETLLEKLAERRDRDSNLISTLEERIAIMLEEASASLDPTFSEEENEGMRQIKESLLTFKETIQRIKADKTVRKNRDFQKAISILQRNPSAISRKYYAAFNELKNLKESLNSKFHKKAQEDSEE